MSIEERSARKPSELWAIEDLFPSDESWEAELTSLRELMTRLPAYQGKLGTSAETLYEYMQLDETLSVLLDRLANYAQRRSDEDTRIARYQAMTDAITAAWVEASSASSFETPELLSIPDETLDEFYRQQPKLTLYRRYFDNRSEERRGGKECL